MSRTPVPIRPVAHSGRPLPKNPTYTVVWHGGMRDTLGSKGGLLPEYDSRSSWQAVEAALEYWHGREADEPAMMLGDDDD